MHNNVAPSPVYSGKNPGPKMLAAWAEQERHDAMRLVAEASANPTFTYDPADWNEADFPPDSNVVVSLSSARMRAAHAAGELPQDRPAPPPMIPLIDVTDETRRFANDAMESVREQITAEYIRAELEVPDEDLRSIWRSIAYDLAEHEFFATGGLCVADDADWEPLPEQAAILDQFATDHRDAWPGQSKHGGLFAWYDARQILRQEKWALLRRERDAQAAEAQRAAERKDAAKDDRSPLIERIDNLKMSKHIGRDGLYQQVYVLASKHRLGEEGGAQSYLKDQIAARTTWDKRKAAALIKEACKNARADKPAPKPKKGERPACNLSDLGHRAACDGSYKVMTDQGDDPRRFHNGGRLTEVREDENGNIRISAIDRPRFKGAHLEAEIDYYVNTQDGGVKNVPSPDALVNRVFNMPLAAYPPLYRITSFPTYSTELAMVMDPGYHTGSGLYHQPKRGVTIHPVPEVPTEEEVRAARDDLVDLFADFPMDGLTRPEIEAAISNGDPVPSLANALSVALTPIMRDTINGPTPNHLATKDKPRTGATLLGSAMTTVGTLEPAAPQSLPESRAEVQKTLVSIFDSGAPFAFFDNIPEGETTESDELAGAMTAYPEYAGRRLGETGMVRARVTQTWLTTGIRTQLSEQLRERTLLIVLDPKMERPGDRPASSFKYAPLIPHIQANAERYMHALLTLVQNWKAPGCPEWKGQSLGGFEAHARIIGGILDAAGIFGFMGNRDKLRARLEVADSPETELLDSMIEEHHRAPTLFRVSGTERPPETVKDDAGKVKPFEYAGHRVVSIIGLLEDHKITPTKWGWHYDKVTDEVIYPPTAKNKVSFHFGAMVGTVREWHEAQTEEAAKQGRYILTKVHKDNKGTLYRLEQLPLIG